MREREREREREERDSLGAEEAATAASRRRLLHLLLPLPVLDRRDAEAPTKTPLPPVHTEPPPRRNLRHAARGRLASKSSAPEGAATAASHRRQLLLAPVDDVVPRETRDRRDSSKSLHALARPEPKTAPIDANPTRPSCGRCPRSSLRRETAGYGTASWSSPGSAGNLRQNVGCSLAPPTASPRHP